MVVFFIISAVIFVGGGLKIWLDYRKDIKAMNERFIREAERINQLERTMIGKNNNS